MAENETDKIEEVADTEGSGEEQSLKLNELNGEQTGEGAKNAPSAAPSPSISAKDDVGSTQNLEAVYDVPVKVSAILGKSTMQVKQILKLGRGAVVELDRKVGEAIDIYVNDRLVARGEIVVIDERLGVTMTEIIKTERK